MSGAMIDVGFADSQLLRPLIRRIRTRDEIARVKVSVEALAHLLDQHRKPLGSDDAALLQEGIGLTGCDDESCVACAAIRMRESNALREHELLEGVKLFAQLLDRIEVGVRHGLFSCASDDEANWPAGAAHRLCGGAE